MTTIKKAPIPLMDQPRRTVRPKRLLAACLPLCLALSLGAQTHSANNGVYGGYVGSDAWFDSMTRSARLNGASAHAQWEAARAEALRSGKSSEVALVVSFPGGNPFPKGRVPDLLVNSPEGKDLGVSPYASKAGTNQATYYLVLPKGASYTLRWMYYFGSKEEFGHFEVPDKAPERIAVVVPYRPTPVVKNEKKTAASGTLLLRTDKGFVPPQSDQAYRPPQIDTNYHAPQSDGRFQAPKSDGGWRPPQSDNSYKPPR